MVSEAECSASTIVATSASINDQNGLLRGRVSEPSETVTAPLSPRNSQEPMLGSPSRPLPGLSPDPKGVKLKGRKNHKNGPPG